MTTSRIVNGVTLAVVVAVLFAIPYLGTSSYVVSLAGTVVIAAILAATVNFLAGEAGMASLGHGAIAAAAAYGAGWVSLQGWGTGSQVLVAFLVTLVVVAVYGLLSMRTSGIYFLMVTLAVGMVVFGLAFRLSTVTRGENGITGIARPEFIAEYWQFYLFVVASFVVCTLILWVVSRSPFGASLRGIRDSESRMRSLGYYVPAYKLGAFMISGMIAGYAGLLSVWHTHFVSPTAAGVHRSVLLIVMVILGGLGTTVGPLIGAAIVVLVENVLSNTVERWPTVLGLIFIFAILFAREGLVGKTSKLFDRRVSSQPPEFALDTTGSDPGATHERNDQ